MKKYKLGEKHQELDVFRVVALVNFGNIRKGDIGGWIEREENLSHEGNCWIYRDAKAYENARVSGNAWVFENACVFGDAKVYGNAQVFGNAKISGNAVVCGDAWVYESADVCGNSRVFGDAKVTKCLFLQQFDHNITATDTHIFIDSESYTWDHYTTKVIKQLRVLFDQI